MLKYIMLSVLLCSCAGILGTGDQDKSLEDIGIHNTHIMKPVTYPDSCGTDSTGRE